MLDILSGLLEVLSGLLEILGGLLGHCLLLLAFSSSLALGKITSDRTQVFRRLLDKISTFRALFQCLQQCRHLRFVVEVRTRPAVAQVRNATQAAMLDPCQLEATPAHGMLFVARRAMVNGRHLLNGSVVERSISIKERRLSKGYSDSFKGPRCKFLHISIGDSAVGWV